MSSALVSSPEEIADNIRRYAAEAGALADLVPYTRSWYAIADAKLGWLFGASKFVGYVGMTVGGYLGASDASKQPGRRRSLREDSTAFDGRVTENILSSWSEAIEMGHPLYIELHQALGRFAAAYGKKPNTLARISVLRLENKAAPMTEYTDDVVALVAAVFRNFTPAQKAAFQKQISPTRSGAATGSRQ